MKRAAKEDDDDDELELDDEGAYAASAADAIGPEKPLPEGSPRRPRRLCSDMTVSSAQKVSSRRANCGGSGAGAEGSASGLRGDRSDGACGGAAAAPTTAAAAVAKGSWWCCLAPPRREPLPAAAAGIAGAAAAAAAAAAADDKADDE